MCVCMDVKRGRMLRHSDSVHNRKSGVGRERGRENEDEDKV